jgi:hypothetical protein
VPRLVLDYGGISQSPTLRLSPSPCAASVSVIASLLECFLFFERGERLFAVLTIEFWGLRLVLLRLLLCRMSRGEVDSRWEISPANPYVLSIIGALFSTGCFYLIANTANWQPFGRFILLTYNLVRSLPTSTFLFLLYPYPSFILVVRYLPPLVGSPCPSACPRPVHCPAPSHSFR